MLNLTDRLHLELKILLNVDDPAERVCRLIARGSVTGHHRRSYPTSSPFTDRLHELTR